jgi:hypothetical protein
MRLRVADLMQRCRDPAQALPDSAERLLSGPPGLAGPGRPQGSVDQETGRAPGAGASKEHAMKVFMGLVATAGMLVSTAATQAQVLLPLRISSALIETVSDFGGSYAAIPPEMPPPRYAPMVLPPQEIHAIARENGFSPLGAPQQRGLFYTVSVIDRAGDDGRLVIDARNGRIVRFMPAYRMGDRMGEETVTTYGPVGTLPPIADYRRGQPPAAAPRLASRTPSVPLPKASPPRAVAAPARPVAVTPAPVAPAPVQQSAVVTPKPAEPAAVPAATAAPTVAAAPVEARPAAPVQPTETMPPVQGLE